VVGNDGAQAHLVISHKTRDRSVCPDFLRVGASRSGRIPGDLPPSATMTPGHITIIWSINETDDAGLVSGTSESVECVCNVGSSVTTPLAILPLFLFAVRC